MTRRFKRKIKLKRNVILITKYLILFLLIIFIHNSKFIKRILSSNAKKYVENNYVKVTDKLTMGANFEAKKNDDIFTLKESKDLKPLIYIYNTHQTEKYLQDNLNFMPTVMHASKYLAEKFEENSLGTIVETRSISDILNINAWSYGKSYKVSRSYIEDTFESNNTIKYFFDIHRDAGSHNYTTICVENKCYAKILFLIGLENPTYYENQKYAEELNKRLNNKINGLSKGILQKEGKKVNGVYNEDFSPRLILIEIGGENNTIDEVYNTLNILSEVLIDYIKEEISNGNK